MLRVKWNMLRELCAYVVSSSISISHTAFPFGIGALAFIEHCCLSSNMCRAGGLGVAGGAAAAAVAGPPPVPRPRAPALGPRNRLGTGVWGAFLMIELINSPRMGFLGVGTSSFARVFIYLCTSSSIDQIAFFITFLPPESVFRHSYQRKTFPKTVKTTTML